MPRVERLHEHVSSRKTLHVLQHLLILVEQNYLYQTQSEARHRSKKKKEKKEQPLIKSYIYYRHDT